MTDDEVTQNATSLQGNHTPRRPSAWGYVMALALLLIGGAVFAAVVLQARAQVRDAVKNLQRVVLPSGEVGFEAEAPGRVTLYYEKRSVVTDRSGNTIYETAMLWDGPALVAEAIGVPGVEPGAVVEAQPWEGTGTDSGMVIYQVSPYVGESVATLDLPAAGTYILRSAEPWPARFPSAVVKPELQRVVAIGHVPVELFTSGLRGVYGAAALLGVSFTAAVLLFLITWARRHPVRRPPAVAAS